MPDGITWDFGQRSEFLAVRALGSLSRQLSHDACKPMKSKRIKYKASKGQASRGNQSRKARSTTGSSSGENDVLSLASSMLLMQQ